LGDVPTTASPGASAVILSPWLIHTLSSAGKPAKMLGSAAAGAAAAAAAGSTATCAWPNSRLSARCTAPPSAAVSSCSP
jgi:hypothetical protein